MAAPYASQEGSFDPAAVSRQRGLPIIGDSRDDRAGLLVVMQAGSVATSPTVLQATAPKAASDARARSAGPGF